MLIPGCLKLSFSQNPGGSHFRLYLLSCNFIPFLVFGDVFFYFWLGCVFYTLSIIMMYFERVRGRGVINLKVWIYNTFSTKALKITKWKKKSKLFDIMLKILMMVWKNHHHLCGWPWYGTIELGTIQIFCHWTPI